MVLFLRGKHIGSGGIARRGAGHRSDHILQHRDGRRQQPNRHRARDRHLGRQQRCHMARFGGQCPAVFVAAHCVNDDTFYGGIVSVAIGCSVVDGRVVFLARHEDGSQCR